jgi:soluble lytic murein transglycosylase
MARLVGLACLLVACAEPATHGGVSPASHAPPAPAPVLARSAQPSPPPTEERWVESVRAGDFREASRRLGLLPEARAKAPEVRYVRARVAMALGDFAGARPLLEGLETELPLLESEVKRDRAECALTAGPFEEAAKYFSLAPDAEGAVKAGLAFERAGDLGKARASLDRALRVLGGADDARSSAVRVRARAARARLAAALHDAGGAATDLRWLAIEAPETEAGRTAEADLAALVPPAHLTAEQKLARGKKLAEAGRLSDALESIDGAATCPGEKPAASSLVRARGFACYLSRADYPQAAALLDQSSRLDAKEAARDAFYAARALSRAQDDAHAIEKYEAVARRFPSTSFAEEATYQAARLRFLLGQWDAAASAYRAYLALHPKRRPGRFSSVVRYELALTLLASKHAREAAPLLHELGEAEDDGLDRAGLRELEGAALAEAGDRPGAIERLGGVIRDRPLSFAALAAAARLGELGAGVPRSVELAAEERAAAPLAVELPPKAALLWRLGFVLDAERDLAAHEAEILARYAPRGNEALCQAYGAIGAGAERYRVGRAAVKSEALDHAPNGATRWAWECVYPTPFEDVVRAAELLRALPPGLVFAVMRQESAFRADALSPANAVGLLQLVPATAERVAREIGVPATPELLRTPAYNVELGAYYLHKVLGTFGGHVALAAAAYNAGPRAVSRWLESGEALPVDVWVARIPYAETRGYVARVVGNLARYSYLHGGEDAVPKISLALPKGVRAGPEDY